MSINMKLGESFALPKSIAKELSEGIFQTLEKLGQYERRVEVITAEPIHQGAVLHTIQLKIVMLVGSGAGNVDRIEMYPQLIGSGKTAEKISDQILEEIRGGIKKHIFQLENKLNGIKNMLTHI